MPTVINNPYKKQKVITSPKTREQGLRHYASAAEEQDNRERPQDGGLGHNNLFGLFDTMGRRSKAVTGSVKACKKRGRTPKFKLDSISYDRSKGVPFSSVPNCKICTAYHNGQTPPKRAHHKLCRLNRKNKKGGYNAPPLRQAMAAAAEGTSSGRDQASLAASFVDRLSTTAKPPESLAHHREQQLIASVPKARRVTTVTIKAPSLSETPQPRQLGEAIKRSLEDQSSDGTTLSQIKQEKAMWMAAIFIFDKHIKMDTLHKRKVTSKPLYDTDAFKEVYARLRQFFPPGQIRFTFPDDNRDEVPCPYYNSLEGRSIYLLDWKLTFPDQKLLCYECVVNGRPRKDCHLDHVRSNWSNNKSLFPLWNFSGLPDYVYLCNYRCGHCRMRYAANDGRLLYLLEPSIRSKYPVDLPYAGNSSATFHLHRDYTDDFHMNMQGSYSNPKHSAAKLHEKIGKDHIRYLEVYFSQAERNCPKGGAKIKDPLSEEEYTRDGFRYLTSTNLSDCYHLAQASPLTRYKYSAMERNLREIQNIQVPENSMVTVDHTHAVLRNFGTRATRPLTESQPSMFTTLSSPEKLAPFYFLVPTTAAKHVSHGVIQALKGRTICKPAILQSDTCPANTSFWKRLFGDGLACRLGLFHLIHRIVDTLNRYSELHGEAVRAVCECFYHYDDGDHANLKESLLDGSFDRRGRKFTAEEIDYLPNDRKWWRRVEIYLRKKIWTPVSIRHRLDRFVKNYKDRKDRNGNYVFTQTTAAAALNQKTHADDIQDDHRYDAYITYPAPKGSHRPLPIHTSCRGGESRLESLHGEIVHYSNVGTKPETADALMAAGIARRNLKQQWSNMQNKRLLDGDGILGLAEWKDHPPYYDMADCHYLRDVAERLGCRNPFSMIIKPKTALDPNQTFGYQYLLEELERLRTTGHDKDGFCLCAKCKDFLHGGLRHDAPVQQAADDQSTTVAEEPALPPPPLPMEPPAVVPAPPFPSVPAVQQQSRPTGGQHRSRQLAASRSVEVGNGMGNWNHLGYAPNASVLPININLPGWFYLLRPDDWGNGHVLNSHIAQGVPADACSIFPPYYCPPRYVWKMVPRTGPGRRRNAPDHHAFCQCVWWPYAGPALFPWDRRTTPTLWNMNNLRS